MKKLFSKKLLVPVTALLLCAVVAFGTVAVNSQRSANINIYVNADDTVKKYDGGTEDSIYLGQGVNGWGMDLGPENVSSYKMTDAYFEVYAQRILKTKPKVIRFIVQPYYLCYLDSPTAGEEEWNAGNLNFDSAYMYNVWRYLEIFEAAGSQVCINWGYSQIAPMEDWFAIKDVPFTVGGKFDHNTRSAPRDLQKFAENLVVFLDECKERGFIGATREKSTIRHIFFYNEVINPNAEFGAFGDKREYWVSMLERVHTEMVKAGYRAEDAIEDRDKHLIMINGGTGVHVNAWSDSNYMYDFIMENAYEKGYCDYIDYHLYLQYGANNVRNNTGDEAYGDHLTMANKFKSTYKGSLGVATTECGYASETSPQTAKKMLGDDGKLFTGMQTPFNATNISQTIYFTLAGSSMTLDWQPWGQYWPASAAMLGNGYLNTWNMPTVGGTYGTIESVQSYYGPTSLFQRYVPEEAKVAKSYVDSANKDSVILATYMNGDDTAIVAEFDYKSGFDYTNFKNGNNYTRTVNINLDGRTGKQYYKYVFEYPEESFSNSPEAEAIFDGNAILPDGVPVTVENGVIHDEISGNHCLVIYSTMAPAQQVGLAKRSREITYSKTGNSAGVRIEVDLDACRQLGDNPEFEFDVYRGVVDVYEEGTAPAYLSDVLKKSYFKTDCSEFKLSGQGTTLSKREGEILPDGDSKTSAIYKAPDDAKVGDTIAVRVKLKGNKNLSNMIGNENKRLQVYDTDVYAVAIIKIIA